MLSAHKKMIDIHPFLSSLLGQLVDPAVIGTRNVLLAAAKHKGSLKRIVLTSSVAGGLQMLILTYSK